MDDTAIQNDIIVFTVLQELRRARRNHESIEVRIFSEKLLEKVQIELDNWEKQSKTN